MVLRAAALTTGTILIVGGVALVFVPAAIVVAGVALAAWGLLSDEKPQ